MVRHYGVMTALLQVRLSTKDKKKIRQIASATRRTMTEVVTDAIRDEHLKMAEAGVFRGDTVQTVKREA